MEWLLRPLVNMPAHLPKPSPRPRHEIEPSDSRIRKTEAFIAKNAAGRVGRAIGKKFPAIDKKNTQWNF